MVSKKVTLLQDTTLWAWSREAGINWPAVTFVLVLNHDRISFADAVCWNSCWVRLLCPELWSEGDTMVTSVSSSKTQNKNWKGGQPAPDWSPALFPSRLQLPQPRPPGVALNSPAAAWWFPPLHHTGPGAPPAERALAAVCCLSIRPVHWLHGHLC